ncbi:flagellar protein FliO/FliZ [Methylomarinovum tepidoasis]|uniref:Flagellar protein n=2 Tax=Methylomarinovum tepidoasis TaxID=2840183 RepID=A0AAU9CBA1_9GAMM|nr:flagellar protein FliO/FliZ [Methylomarinovum sp. IN45]
MRSLGPIAVMMVSPALAAAPAGGMPPVAAGQWLAGLVVVLFLLLLALWGLKRLTRWQEPAGGKIRLLGGIALGGREKLLVVEVGETQLVLGVAPGRVQTLHVLEGDRRLQAGEPATPPFARQLQQILNKRQAP